MSTPLLLLALVTAQAVPQRPSGSDCISGSFEARGVRVCNLRDALSSVPMVRVGAQYDRLDFTRSADETAGLGWVGLEALAKPRLWVGVLDWQVESPGHELVFVVSTDAGQSWTRLPPLVKPHYLALFKKLQLSSPREWTVTLELDDCAGCGVRTGKHVFKTRDGGASWTPAAR